MNLTNRRLPSDADALAHAAVYDSVSCVSKWLCLKGLNGQDKPSYFLYFNIHHSFKNSRSGIGFVTKDSLTLNALFNMFYDNEMQNAPAASRALESDRHRSRAASSIHGPVHAPAAPALAGIYRPPVTRSEHREPPRDPCDNRHTTGVTRL